MNVRSGISTLPYSIETLRLRLKDKILMKTLLLLVLVAIGVAVILYFRINVGMSWDEMSQALEKNIIPRLLMLLVVLGAFVFTVVKIAKRN